MNLRASADRDADAERASGSTEVPWLDSGVAATRRCVGPDDTPADAVNGFWNVYVEQLAAVLASTPASAAGAAVAMTAKNEAARGRIMRRERGRASSRNGGLLLGWEVPRERSGAGTCSD